jgi:hypothetical protein
MYAYMLFLTEDPDKFQVASLYETVAIVSPSLRLPRFNISPSWKNLDRMSTKDMKQIDKSDEFKHAFNRVERVRLGIDETYENYHLIQSAERDRVQDFLTRDRLLQLNAMSHQYDIRCNDSSFSIDFLPWDQRPDNYLKRASEDAETIYKIFTEVLS